MVEARVQWGGHGRLDASRESHCGWMLKSDDGERAKGCSKTLLPGGVTQVRRESMNLDFLGLYLFKLR